MIIDHDNRTVIIYYTESLRDIVEKCGKSWREYVIICKNQEGLKQVDTPTLNEHEPQVTNPVGFKIKK